MEGRVALCVDSATRGAPELIGLGGESICSQDWLEVLVSGEEARRLIADDRGIVEAWVASCEDVDPINLAATLKADRPELEVRLIAADRCGSLYSRAHTAAIDEVLELASFARRYGDAKQRSLSRSAAAAPAALPTSAPAHARESAGPVVAEPAVAKPAVAGPVPDEQPMTMGAPLQLAASVKPRGFVMPIVSGSGGAGKSAVSVVAAHMATRMGYRTLLVDYDLQFGDIAMLAGVERPLAIDDALAHPEKLDLELRKGVNPTVIGAPARLEEAESVAKELPRLIDELSDAFDLVVANTGAAWADYHAALLEKSSTALFLVDQRTTSLWACRHALELCARCGIATGPFQFAINRCRKGAPLSSIDVSYALQGAQVHEIEDGGPDVEEYLASGSVSDLIELSNPFVKSVADLLGRVLPGGNIVASEQLEHAGGRRSGKKRGRRPGRKRGWAS